MIKTKIFQAINHVLDQNDWMQDDLLAHKNKTITLRLDENLFDIQLYISENGQLRVTEKIFENKANLVIKLNTDSLVKMMFKQDPEDMDIHGDMKLAKVINEILKKIEWDISIEVEKYFGLTIASYFKKITSLLSKRLKQISKILPKRQLNITKKKIKYLLKNIKLNNLMMKLIN